jgi:hypothetical protein
MTTADNNRLIAEFMGLKQVLWLNDYNVDNLVWVQKDFIENFDDVENYGKDSTFDWINAHPQTSELHYHSSWDWLMPVVEKIETTRYNVFHPKRGKKLSDVYISTDYQDHKDFPVGWTANVMTTTMGDIYRSDRCDEIFKAKLEATYKAVVEFIKWYNEKDRS